LGSLRAEKVSIWGRRDARPGQDEMGPVQADELARFFLSFLPLAVFALRNTSKIQEVTPWMNP
jgi:hypothetical protein